VTVAKEIELEDPKENMGAQLVREVSSKTSEVAGDGNHEPRRSWPRPSSARASMAGHRRCQPHGPRRRASRRPLRIGDRRRQETLQARQSSKAIAQVGTISANNDETIARVSIIAPGRWKKVRQGRASGHGWRRPKGLETYPRESVEVDAVRMLGAHLSPYFVTDAERMECVQGTRTS